MSTMPRISHVLPCLSTRTRPRNASHATRAPSRTKINSIMTRNSRSGVSIVVLRAQSADAFNSQFLDGDGSARPVARIARHVRDFVGHVLAFHDFAKNCVPVIEPGRRRHGDEKLAAVRVRARVGHRKESRFRMLQGRMKLISELVARSAYAAALRASALDHELRDDAVKNQSVVERPFLFLPCLFVGEFLCPFGQPHEIGYCLWRLFFI